MDHELRKRNYIPVLFDFDGPENRDTVETMSTLAHLARFVVADLTDSKSVLQELQKIVPNLPSVPVAPIILASDKLPGMIDHFKNFRSFLDIYSYSSIRGLIDEISEAIILPVENFIKSTK